MKIRHPALIKAVGWLGAQFVRAWVGTLRFHYRPLGPDVAPARLPDVPERYLGIFWHENILLPAYCFGRAEIRVLISQHADGQMIAEVARRLGFGLVRGSTTRGGAEAVREMIRAAGANFHVAVTPDGPRGPRRRLQPGVVYLAARTGLPIVVIGVGYDRPWRMKSWDRFAVPRPFTRAACVTGAPIRVPAEADRAELERHQRVVEEALEHATALAERWAESGTWPEEAKPEGGTRDAA